MGSLEIGKTSFLFALMRWRLQPGAWCLLTGGLGLTTQSVLGYGICAWSAKVQFAWFVSPASWLTCPDKSRMSNVKVVQDIWEVYLETLRLVPGEVQAELYEACHVHPDVDRAWKTWCAASESGLLTAYKAAGGSYPQGDLLPFLGRGMAVIRTRPGGW